MKKTVLIVIITAVICVTGTVYAVNQINAEDVIYDNNTNVKQKIDSLYTIQTTTVSNLETQLNNFNTITVQHCNGGQFVFLNLAEKYSKFKVVAVDGTSTDYKVKLLSGSATVVYENAELNHEYLTSEVSKTEIITNNGWKCAAIRFYN